MKMKNIFITLCFFLTAIGFSQVQVSDGYGFLEKTTAELAALTNNVNGDIYYNSDIQLHVKWDGTAFVLFSDANGNSSGSLSVSDQTIVTGVTRNINTESQAKLTISQEGIDVFSVGDNNDNAIRVDAIEGLSNNYINFVSPFQLPFVDITITGNEASALPRTLVVDDNKPYFSNGTSWIDLSDTGTSTGGVTVDPLLSGSSTNPVENQVVFDEFALQAKLGADNTFTGVNTFASSGKTQFTNTDFSQMLFVNLDSSREFFFGVDDNVNIFANAGVGLDFRSDNMSHFFVSSDGNTSFGDVISPTSKVNVAGYVDAEGYRINGVDVSFGGGGSSETAETIKTKLETLVGDSRLSSDAVNLPVIYVDYDSAITDYEPILNPLLAQDLKVVLSTNEIYPIGNTLVVTGEGELDGNGSTITMSSGFRMVNQESKKFELVNVKFESTFDSGADNRDLFGVITIDNKEVDYFALKNVEVTAPLANTQGVKVITQNVPNFGGVENIVIEDSYFHDIGAIAIEMIGSSVMFRDTNYIKTVTLRNVHTYNTGTKAADFGMGVSIVSNVHNFNSYGLVIEDFHDNGYETGAKNFNWSGGKISGALTDLDKFIYIEQEDTHGVGFGENTSGIISGVNVEGHGIIEIRGRENPIYLDNLTGTGEIRQIYNNVIIRDSYLKTSGNLEVATGFEATIDGGFQDFQDDGRIQIQGGTLNIINSAKIQQGNDGQLAFISAGELNVNGATFIDGYINTTGAVTVNLKNFDYDRAATSNVLLGTGTYNFSNDVFINGVDQNPVPSGTATLTLSGTNNEMLSAGGNSVDLSTVITGGGTSDGLGSDGDVGDATIGGGGTTLTIDTNTIGTNNIIDDQILAVDFNSSNALSDGYIPLYDSASGGFTWTDPFTFGGGGTGGLGSEDQDIVDGVVRDITTTGSGQLSFIHNTTEVLRIGNDNDNVVQFNNVEPISGTVLYFNSSVKPISVDVLNSLPSDYEGYVVDDITGDPYFSDGLVWTNLTDTGTGTVAAQDIVRWDNKGLTQVIKSTVDELTISNFIATGADEGKRISNLMYTVGDTITIPKLDTQGHSAKFLIPMDSTKHFVATDSVYFKVNGTSNYERAVTLTTNFNFSATKLYDTLSIDSKTNQTLYDLTGGLIGFPYTPYTPPSLYGTNPNPGTGTETYPGGIASNYQDNNEQNVVPTGGNAFGVTMTSVASSGVYADYALRVEATGDDGDNDRFIYSVSGIGIGSSIDYAITYRAKGAFAQISVLGTLVPMTADEQWYTVTGTVVTTSTSVVTYPIYSDGNGSGIGSSTIPPPTPNDYIEIEGVSIKINN